MEVGPALNFCPLCGVDVRVADVKHGVMEDGDPCPVTPDDLEQYARTGGGRIARLLERRREEELLEEELLLLFDEDDDLDD